MKIKKIVALMLCVAMLCAMAVSCEKKEPTPEEVLKGATEKLITEPYYAVMTTNYGCDDELMAESFEAMSDMATDIYVDGNNMQFSIDFMGVEMEYIVVDKTLYLNVSGYKVKSELDDDQLKDFVNQNGMSISNLGNMGFKEMSMTTDEAGISTVICKGFTDEMNEMIDSMVSSLGTGNGIEVSVDYDNISAVSVIGSDGRYINVAMDMAMALDIPEYGAVNVTVSYSMDFDASKGKAITHPEDADSYTEMNASDILG